VSRDWWLVRCRWPPGEYVSVSSQSDTEQADLARERKELNEKNPGFELDELANI
jgi:VIT1/CCC1 family predicted Fe2+/Mn2+ transporter